MGMVDLPLSSNGLPEMPFKIHSKSDKEPCKQSPDKKNRRWPDSGVDSIRSRGKKPKVLEIRRDGKNTTKYVQHFGEDTEMDVDENKSSQPQN